MFPASKQLNLIVFGCLRTILNVMREVLVSRRNEHSLSNGGVGEDFVKELVGIRQQRATAFQAGRTKLMLGSE